MGYSNGILESDEKGGSGERGEQGLPGIGFKLTDDGNFDIDGKRLTDVSQPVDGGDAANKKYVDTHSGLHTQRYYHFRTDFTLFDHNEVLQQLQTSNIQGLLTDYSLGYYQLPVTSTDGGIRELEFILSKYSTQQGTYTALLFMYGYQNGTKLTGQDLGPILWDVTSPKFNVLHYEDDNSMDTVDHTKGVIWFTGGVGSLYIKLRFFQSLTHFVILTRCLEGKIGVGFNNEIFNVKIANDASLYFENINMNERSITNLSDPTGPKQPVTLGFGDIRYLRTDGVNAMRQDLRMGQKKIVGLADPTGDGQATNKKYVDTENKKQDIAINDKASKSYVDNEIAKVVVGEDVDLKAYLPIDGSRGMTGDFDNGGNNILKVENLTDYKDTDPYDYRVKDVKSVVNKEYLNEKFIKKVDKDGREYYDLKQLVIKNSAPHDDGSYDNNTLVSKAFVNAEIAKLPKPATDVLKLDGSKAMTGNLDMGDHTITGIRSSAADNAALTVGGAKATYLPLLGDRSMQGNLNMGGHAIINIKPFVEDDSSQAVSDAQRNEVINFGYFHTERGELKRLINSVSSNALNRKNPDPMEDDIDMANHSIINLKEPEDHQATYAANVKFVANAIVDNNTTLQTEIDSKIKASEERSIRAVSQENAFLKVMDDDLFVIEDDDIHRVGVVDKKFHQVNQQTYQFKIDYDSKIGYYSTRLGVSVIYLPISHYTIIFEMYFSDKIDPDQITIDSKSGTLQVNKINTKISSDHTRSVINFYKDQILPSDDELDIDIALKNKTGQSYDSDTQIFVVVYGVYGTQNDVDIQVWDRYFYIDDKKIYFEAPIDMVDKDIENVNNLWINNELNMNNRQIKNLGDGNENSDGVNVKQLNEMETNVTKYVTDEFKKVNPVLSNNSDFIKFIYRNLIRNDSKLFLIKELYFPDSIQGSTQNNYTYQTNGDNKGDVTFYLTFVHKATTSDNMMIALHWEGASRPIYIFVSKDRVVASINTIIDDPSLTSYRIPSYFIGKRIYFWIMIQNNIILILFSGGSRTISIRNPFLLDKDANLRIINVSDSPFTIQRGLITKNIYNRNSDAFKDVREFEISKGTFVGAS